jgi:hypothetical protein
MFSSSGHAEQIFFWNWPLFLLLFGPILMSRLSGWYQLSSRFRATSEPQGKTRCVGPFFVPVQMRRQGYGGILITRAEDGLYLSMPFISRIGHPPLCIPWKEIQIGWTKFLFCRAVVLTLGDLERVPMRIPERIARNLGILERIPNASNPPAEPNFDTLSDSFGESLRKKSG